ncbi:hypothetical protein LINPERPRIM_LOCUS37515 [Linum perenne]
MVSASVGMLLGPLLSFLI